MPSVCGTACGQASGKQGQAAQALTSGPAIKKYAGMVEPAMFHGEKSRHLWDVGKRGKSLTSHTHKSLSWLLPPLHALGKSRQIQRRRKRPSTNMEERWPLSHWLSA